MSRFVVGVMGAGENARPEDVANAHRLGELLAREGWVVLSGGRTAGVMDAVNRGAKSVPGSLTIGILPSRDSVASEFVDVAIVTDLGNARNNVNVLSSQVVVVCGKGEAGTVSEIALALKARKPVVLCLAASDEAQLYEAFLKELGRDLLTICRAPEAVIEQVKFVQSQLHT
ncbi:MAG: LOG family protein [Acidobacteria bacterium]|nr:LOG family protein [Acidobacteriota bacterium]